MSRKTKQLECHRSITRHKISRHHPYFAISFIDPAIRKFCTPLKVHPSIKENRYGLDYVGGFISTLSLWGKHSGHVAVASKTQVSVTPSVVFHSSYSRCSVRLYRKPEIKFMYSSYQTKLNKTPWPQSASELYRQSGRRRSAKLVPTFADRGVSRGQRNGSPRPF